MISEILFDIQIWTIKNLEEIVGLPVGYIAFHDVNVGSELLKNGLSIIATVTSAYIIHRLKMIWTKKKSK
jgi:hypothetical protein